MNPILLNAQKILQMVNNNQSPINSGSAGFAQNLRTYIIKDQYKKREMYMLSHISTKAITIRYLENTSLQRRS